MYNYFMIIGKLKSFENDKLIVNCQRDFKDANGIYKVDEFEFEIQPTLKPLLENIVDKNLFLSIKGRIIPINNQYKLFAERIMIQGTYE